MKFAEKVITLIKQRPGLTDRELTDILKGKSTHQSQVYQQTTLLARKGILERVKRPDGKTGNYVSGAELPVIALVPKTAARSNVKQADLLSEDILKKHLQTWFEKDGWETTIAWGKKPGVDIYAEKGKAHWVVEVKGVGSLDAMRVNYFIAILGETLQRMKDESEKYSIALPDIQQYRNLWARLPKLAKERTQITMLFVDHTGHVSELE